MTTETFYVAHVLTLNVCSWNKKLPFQTILQYVPGANSKYFLEFILYNIYSRWKPLGFQNTRSFWNFILGMIFINSEKDNTPKFRMLNIKYISILHIAVVF